MPALDGRGWPDDGAYGRRNLRVKVKEQFGDGGDGRVNRPPGVGERMADQRREQMLPAALEGIVERGYADPRIADVAERAGASPALVIYYFKTKDQLLTEAIRYLEDSC